MSKQFALIGLLTASVLLICAVACQFEDRNADDVLLARVHDQELRMSDASRYLSPTNSPADSISQLRTFVEQWVRDAVLLEEAEQYYGYNRPHGNYSHHELVYRHERESHVLLVVLVLLIAIGAICLGVWVFQTIRTDSDEREGVAKSSVFMSDVKHHRLEEQLTDDSAYFSSVDQSETMTIVNSDL